MENVCGKTDCPLYNSYFNPLNFEPVKEIYDDFKKELDSSYSKYQRPSIEYSAQWLEQATFKIRTTCLACIHFEKKDMYSELLGKEAKGFLLSD